MSTIDLGDNPVGSTPTDEQKTQLRSSIGLGNSDTVEFGAIIPPSGTTAEIDGISNAEVGSVVFDTDRDQYVRFTSSSEYIFLGASVSNEYFVDPTNGSDTKGKRGVFPFATINAALKDAQLDDSVSTLSIVCLAGVYTEEDAFNGVTDTFSISITFQTGSFWIPTTHANPFFNATAANIQLVGIFGKLIISNNQKPLFTGRCSAAGTVIQINTATSASATDPLIEVTEGLCSFSSTSPISVPSGNSFSFLKASGDGHLKLNNIEFISSAVYAFNTVPALVLLSDNAKVNINNAVVRGLGLLEITTDTPCKATIRNCISTANAAAAFLSQVPQSVAAPSGSSLPEVYAVGTNLVDVAASNITVNVDAGSLEVSSTVLDIVF